MTKKICLLVGIFLNMIVFLEAKDNGEISIPIFKTAKEQIEFAEQRERNADFKRAIAAYEKVLTTFPDERDYCAIVMSKIGSLYFIQGDYGKAISIWQKVISHYPENKKIVCMSWADIGAAIIIRGKTGLGKDELNEAASAFAKAQKLSKEIGDEKIYKEATEGLKIISKLKEKLERNASQNEYHHVFVTSIAREIKSAGLKTTISIIIIAMMVMLGKVIQSRFNKKLSYEKTKWNFLDVMMTLVIYFIIGTFVFLLIFPMFRDRSQGRVVALIGEYIIILFLIFLLLKIRYKINFYKIVKNDIYKIAKFIGIGFIVGIAMLCFSFLFGGYNFENSRLWIAFNSIGLGRDMVLLRFLQLFTAVILAPFIEEIVYRGVVYSYLRPNIGVISSVIISSVLWCIGHQKSIIPLLTFTYGCVVAITVEKTKSLVPAIFAHAIFNLFI